MSDGLDELEQSLGDLLAATDAAGRVKLAHQLGRELRKSQASRIRGQTNPDGSAFEPRKERAPLRAKAGRIRRRKKAGPMFRQMGRADALAWEASPDGVAIGYVDNALGRIARVHQLGLRDRVGKAQGAAEAQYPSRRLLGLTEADKRRVLDLVLKRLGA